MYSSTSTLDYADAETSRQKHGLRLRLRDFFFFFQERKKVECARDRREHVPDFLIDLIEFFGVGF